MLVELTAEETTCSICCSKFSSDTGNVDDEIRRHLPVLSSSRCDHWFCHGCIFREQLRVAEDNNGKIPKWLKCMTCREKTSFRPDEPKYHRLLIDLLGRAQQYTATKIKQEDRGDAVSQAPVHKCDADETNPSREGNVDEQPSLALGKGDSLALDDESSIQHAARHEELSQEKLYVRVKPKHDPGDILEVLPERKREHEATADECVPDQALDKNGQNVIIQLIEMMQSHTRCSKAQLAGARAVNGKRTNEQAEYYERNKMPRLASADDVNAGSFHTESIVEKQNARNVESGRRGEASAAEKAKRSSAVSSDENRDKRQFEANVDAHGNDLKLENAIDEEPPNHSLTSKLEDPPSLDPMNRVKFGEGPEPIIEELLGRNSEMKSTDECSGEVNNSSRYPPTRIVENLISRNSNCQKKHNPEANPEPNPEPSRYVSVGGLPRRATNSRRAGPISTIVTSSETDHHINHHRTMNSSVIGKDQWARGNAGNDPPATAASCPLLPLDKATSSFLAAMEKSRSTQVNLRKGSTDLTAECLRAMGDSFESRRILLWHTRSELKRSRVTQDLNPATASPGKKLAIAMEHGPDAIRPDAQLSIGNKRKGIQCMCGQATCKKLASRLRAIGDDSEFITIPAMPRRQKTLLQKHEARLNAIISEHCCLDSAPEGGTLHILHWPRRQRKPMLDNERKESGIRRAFRGLLTDGHRPLINEMKDDGSLTGSHQTEGNLYWNIPGGLEGVDKEVRQMEVDYWFEEGSLVKKIVAANGTQRTTIPYEGETLKDIVSEETNKLDENITGVSPDESGNLEVQVINWIRSTKQNRLKNANEKKGILVPLNVNDLASALIPVHDSIDSQPANGNLPSPLLRTSRNCNSDNTSTVKERVFTEIEGMQLHLDKASNDPIYYSKSKRRGYWLVGDYLLKEDLELILDFTKVHGLYADLGNILFILCKFVSDIPKAKIVWDTCKDEAKQQDTDFEEYFDLCDRFQQDLVIIAASHICGNENLSHHLTIFRRLLWEYWDPFNIAMDCAYQRKMRDHRRSIRQDALRDVAKENQSEVLSHLSGLHKFLMVLVTQQLKDEKTERLYYRLCSGYTTSGSFLKPLRHFSYTQLFRVMDKVFKVEPNGMDSLRAESFLNFCLVSHLLYEGSFPINYEGLAIQRVHWKKLSIAGIVKGVYIAVPVDSHLLKFFGIYAKSEKKKDLIACADVFRVRTDPKVGRYTNDFLPEFGQIFDRGTGASITFAIAVLNELVSRDPEYGSIVSKWLSMYKNKHGYNNIVRSGGVNGLTLT